MSPDRRSQAFPAFRRAIEEGVTEDFLSIVSEDFRFMVPIPFKEWNGEQHGKSRFEELVRFEREHLNVRMIPIIELENERHGIVVFRAEGTLGGMTYSNELAIVFEFENDLIRSFREYVGFTGHLLSLKTAEV